MAFHGLRWSPDIKEFVNPSEADAVQRMELACQIRTDGFEAAMDTASKMSQVYSERYAHALQAQQEIENFQTQLANHAQQLTQQEIEAGTTASYTWKDKHPDFDKYFQDLNENTRAFVQEHCRLLHLAELYQANQTALWQMSERIEMLKSICELWKFDVYSATKHKERLIRLAKEEKMKEAQLQKAANLYLAHIRRQIRLTRRNSVEILAEDVSATENSDHAGNVLSRLDKLLLKDS